MSLPLHFTCSGSYVFRSRIEEKKLSIIGGFFWSREAVGGAAFEGCAQGFR